MEGIESLALFEEKITLSPRDLANPKLNIHGILLGKLASKMEGRCSLHGWVLPDSLKVLSRSMGYVEQGRFTGDIVFHVQVQAKVLNPPSGSHIVCEVIGNNMMGMYVSYKVKMREFDKKTKQTQTYNVDAIKVILPRDLHINDEAFANVQIGDKVYVEIKKSRFQVNDKFILSVGVFEGKVGSDYVAPQVVEEEEIVYPEEGPSGVAEKLTTQFQEANEATIAQQKAIYDQIKAEEERKFQERFQREEEAKKQQDEIPPLVPVQPVVLEEPIQQPESTLEPVYFNAKTVATNKELDNRYPASFELDGKTWPSVEHYYQAMKFPSLPDFQEQIRKAPLAEAMKLGKAKDPSKPIRADWKEKREEIMEKAIRAKFTQHEKSREALIKTYPHPLIFADGNDAFWGYGRTKQGQNKLGKLLMSYRNDITGMEAING